MTTGTEEFLNVAGEFLRAEPARNSVLTAAVSQAALDAGVREVVLYTDLANPVSNALYERLGYRAVEDRVVLSFEPPVTLHP